MCVETRRRKSEEVRKKISLFFFVSNEEETFQECDRTRRMKKKYKRDMRVCVCVCVYITRVCSDCICVFMILILMMCITLRARIASRLVTGSRYRGGIVNIRVVCCCARIVQRQSSTELWRFRVKTSNSPGDH